MRSVVAILLVAALFGCASSSSRDHGVRVTRDAAVVEHCKHIGAVQSVPPYSVPGADLEQIRSRTVAIGADTVLLNTARRESVSGVAYRCKAS
jgi:hypothetical protein